MGGSMNRDVKIYLLMRGLRWLAWGAFFLYSLHYVLVPGRHLDHFGHLLPTTEACMFGFALLSVFMGCFELMARGKAGLAQPKFAQLVPDKVEGRNLIPNR
jgi:hypothetical protein